MNYINKILSDKFLLLQVMLATVLVLLGILEVLLSQRPFGTFMTLLCFGMTVGLFMFAYNRQREFTDKCLTGWQETLDTLEEAATTMKEMENKIDELSAK